MGQLPDQEEVRRKESLLNEKIKEIQLEQRESRRNLMKLDDEIRVLNLFLKIIK